MELAGLDWTPIFVDSSTARLGRRGFRNLNPMGEVPVLVDGDLPGRPSDREGAPA